MFDDLKREIQKALAFLYQVEVPLSEIELRRVPKPELGDLAVQCSALRIHCGKPPPEIAKTLGEQLQASALVSSAVPAGPYLNIRLRSSALFNAAIAAMREKSVRVLNPERIMVEYLSPNTNKPLHLGHVRNGVLGSSVANLLKSLGHTVIRANLINDRGEHICKSMLAYQRYGNGSTPQTAGKKGDHFVGDWYVRFAEEEKKEKADLKEGEPSRLAQEVRQMLAAWEAGDPEVRSLWQLMNSWVLVGMKETCMRYKFDFETEYLESDTYMLGKQLVDKGLQLGIFVRDEKNNVVRPLDVETFGTHTDGSARMPKVLRADSTSLYLTQDIGTAVKKAEDHALDYAINVVACEQDYHFQVLYDILRAFGYPWAEKLYHLSYEMVELPEGKMKSREGTVVDADDLADEMSRLAVEEIQAKVRAGELNEAELVKRAEAIGLAAIKFYLLRVSPRKKILFNSKKSLSFEGDSGPYCLYAYVRVRRLLERAKEVLGESFDPVAPRAFALDAPEERALALNLLELPGTIRKSAEVYNPSILADQVLRIAGSFNQFYAKCPVFDAGGNITSERLALAHAAAEGIAWGLSLLGIDVVEKM